MKKLNKYVIALYASAIVGLTEVGYVAHNTIRDKMINKTTAIVGGLGLITYTILLGSGAMGLALDNKTKKNKLEGELTK